MKTPGNVGLREIEEEKLLFSLTIIISRIEMVLFSTTPKVNLILGCWRFKNLQTF